MSVLRNLYAKTPWARLRAAGIVPMNQRNADFIMLRNPRRLYPLVDDKLKTKSLAQAAHIAVPELYGVVRAEHDLRNLGQILSGHGAFVIKPSKGAGGNGILVVTERRPGQSGKFVKASGELIELAEIKHHVSNILSGMYSLGGIPDVAMIEYCVQFDPVFERVTHRGVPDIRTIVYRGLPIAAMVRLPTRASDGKANLHQGAVGAGVDMKTGLTMGGVCLNRPVSRHPDTDAVLEGIEIPGWPLLLELAARCYDLAALGYLGVDVVLDRDHGPLVLELNARPGLAIQLANRRGLLPMLRRVDAVDTIPDTAAGRVELALSLLDEAR